MRRVILVVIAACVLAHAQRMHVMFAGLAQGQAPSFEKRFEEYVRDRLNVASDVTLVDYGETERLVEKVGLRDFASVSRSLVRSLERYSADSTLIVWGRLESYTVEPKRCWIFGARAEGNVSVVLTLYSLHADKYMFVGNACATTHLGKDPAWFRRVAQVTHISAQDKDKIADELGRQTADRAVSVISAVVRSIFSKEGPKPGAGVSEEEKAPSLYDVFEIPSGEGPPVEEAKPAPPGAGEASPPASQPQPKSEPQAPPPPP